MVKTNLLKAQMAIYGYTFTRLAKEIGVTRKTLSVKINHTPGNFTQDEIQKIVTILKIENPAQIFFSQE